jgi:hypothetical protein
MSEFNTQLVRFCLECGKLFGCCNDGVFHTCEKPVLLCKSPDCPKKARYKIETTGWCPKCFPSVLEKSRRKRR